MLQRVNSLLRHRPRTHAAVRLATNACLGAGMALSFAPYHHTMLAGLLMVCWADHLARTDRPSYIFPCLWAYMGVGLPWLHQAMHVVLPMPPWLCVVMNIGCCAVLALLASWPFVLLRACQQAWGTSPLLFALAWGQSEATLAWLFGAWRCFGYSQAPHGWWLGWSPWLGAIGLSMLLAYGAALLAATCRFPRRFLGVFLAWVAVSLAFQPALGTPSTPSWLTHIVRVDGHQHPWFKWYRGGGQVSLQQYVQRTLVQHPRPGSLVIWPETAIAGVDRSLHDALSKLSTSFHQHRWGLVTGILHRDLLTGHLTNAALGLGEATGRVDKRRLVAFGEYLPYPSFLLPLWKALGLPGFYLHPASSKPQVIIWHGHRLGVLICYDVVDVEALRALQPQLDALLVITDDSWFQSDSMVAQHRQLATFRSAELQRPVVFANNSFPT